MTIFYELQSAAGNTIDISTDKAQILSLFNRVSYPRRVYEIQAGKKKLIARTLY